jgi:hypothetical protein
MMHFKGETVARDRMPEEGQSYLASEAFPHPIVQNTQVPECHTLEYHVLSPITPKPLHLIITRSFCLLTFSVIFLFLVLLSFFLLFLFFVEQGFELRVSHLLFFVGLQFAFLNRSRS